VKTTLAAALNWRPRTSFYYGWLIIAMAALGTFVATGISQLVLGGVQGFIFQDLAWNRSTIALAVTIGTWASGLLAPFVGRLADRYGPRWLMPFGLVVVGLAFFSLAGMHSVWQFYVAYILGRAISNPILVGVVPRTAAVNFFRRKRNIALSLTGMSRPVSSSINIQIISAVAVRYGWRAAYRYLGILAFCLTLPLMASMRRRPEDIGLLPDGARPEADTRVDAEVDDGPAPEPSGGRRAGPSPADGEQERSRAPATGGDREHRWTVRDAMRTRAFWLVGITAGLAILGVSTVDFSLVLYLQDKAGISEAQAAGVLSLSTFLAVANLLWGYLADKFTPRRCLMVALVCNAMIILYLSTVGSMPAAYTFGVLWGLFTGSVGVLEQMVLAQYFGRESYGAIVGSLTPLQMGALGLGPSLGALVHDITGSYDGLIMAVIGVYLLAALLIFLARPPDVKRRASSSL
jgi:MFS family permease